MVAEQRPADPEHSADTMGPRPRTRLGAKWGPARLRGPARWAPALDIAPSGAGNRVHSYTMDGDQAPRFSPRPQPAGTWWSRYSTFGREWTFAPQGAVRHGTGGCVRRWGPAR